MGLKLPDVEFGYACISSLIDDCSPARTVQLGKFREIEDRETKIYRLERVARANLENTIRLLWHNIAEGIKLYRFTSQLIPLANHPEGQIWNYEEELRPEFNKIGNIIKKNGLRVSSHPGQYTVINTRHDEKFINAKRDLIYHDRVFRAMGLDKETIMVTHVGGVYGDKEKSMERFVKNFKRLPVPVQERLTIENDDSSYTVKDVLQICQELDRPMVLDVHHHKCNNNGDNLSDLLDDIFSTWDNLQRPPKIHFSSPRSEKHPKRHASYIDPDEFLTFLELMDGRTFDVMIEAKKQDEALLKLWKDIGLIKN